MAVQHGVPSYASCAQRTAYTVGVGGSTFEGWLVNTILVGARIYICTLFSLLKTVFRCLETRLEGNLTWALRRPLRCQIHR
jgi:hypothetical protein